MQTQLADFIRDTPDGIEAEAILRSCVHCGFCTATCPTYQLFGDELDGPRGRIYLIKQMVEGEIGGTTTRLHLDRCLTCRSCETTCPSGVQYGRLLEIGRKQIEIQAPRSLPQRLWRHALLSFMLSPNLFHGALAVGQRMRALLPRPLRDKIPAITHHRISMPPRHERPRKMLMLAGCVQPAMLPNVNPATARVLDALGIQTIIAPESGCCGALRLHLGHQDAALDDMRRNIDAWWPHIEAGAEAIVLNASGCGATIREYGHLLRNDPVYADKAARVTELARDISEVLADSEALLVRRVTAIPHNGRGAADNVASVAYHPPCTLQHGQAVRGKVEHLLTKLGIEVQLPNDSHLCCGSAGSYSIFHPHTSYQLRDNKLAALDALHADRIVSGNVGCICHLQSGTATPVQHWIELVDAMLTPA